MRIAPATDTASRHIAADPAEVWHALTDPGTVIRWLPPADAAGRIEAWDLRPGGRFRLTLTFGAGAGPAKTTETEDVVEGRFVSMEPERELVQDVDFVSDDPAFAGTMRMTWRLAPGAAGTDVTVTCENVPEGIGAEDHDAGLTSSLAKLAACLEGANAEY